MVAKVHLQNLFSQADQAAGDSAVLRVPPAAHLWDCPRVDETRPGVYASDIDLGDKLDLRGFERISIGCINLQRRTS